MSPDAQVRERPRDLDAEQEIELGRFWKAIVLRWWLILIGLVAGAIIGLLVSLGGGTQYTATSEVYLGQPLSPGGLQPLTSYSTSLALAAFYVTSEAAIRNAAARADLTPDELRGHVSSKPILGLTGTKLGTAAPLIEITVTGSSRSKIPRAANALANGVVGKLSGYSISKLDTLNAKLTRDKNQLKLVTSRLDTALAQQRALTGGHALSSTEQLIASLNLNSLVNSLVLQQYNLQGDQTDIQQQIAAVQELELPRVIAFAAATRSGGPSRRSAIVVGAVIGFLLGLLAAVLWEPVAVRVRQAT